METTFEEARKDPRWLNRSGEGNYVMLEAKGDGQFVGVTFSVFENQWGGWNEGDEMIWIDGEKEPRIHGTGGEDYFNFAWGFSKMFATPLVGLTEFTGWEPARASLCIAGTWRGRSASGMTLRSRSKMAKPTCVPTTFIPWRTGTRWSPTRRCPRCRASRTAFRNSRSLVARGRTRI